MSKKLISPVFLLVLALIGCEAEEPSEQPVAELPKPCHEKMPTYRQWYPDADGDGYAARPVEGVEAEFLASCEREVPGYSRKRMDCDDTDPTVHVGAEEVWYDGIDQDCDRVDDYDQDGDGDRIPKPKDFVGNYPPDEWGKDCDDTAFTTNSGFAHEFPDGLDNDCDGEIDENTTGRWYCDWDYDGYAGSSIWIRADHPNLTELLQDGSGPCHRSNFMEHPDDCDDKKDHINPGAEERVNGEDDNCNNRIDEHARRLPR